MELLIRLSVVVTCVGCVACARFDPDETIQLVPAAEWSVADVEALRQAAACWNLRFGTRFEVVREPTAAQTVDVAFANGVLASFTMHSSSHRSMREVRVDGTHGSARGELAGLEQGLEVTDHRTGRTRRTDFPVTTDGHGGGEGPLVGELLRAVRDGTRAGTSARDAWESHRIAFAAMRSAATGEVVNLTAAT